MKNKKRIPAHELIAGDIFHPGEFIANEIEAREMKHVELANMLDISKSEMSLIINGKRNITVAIAIKLEKALEISAETWMNLQMRYEIEKVKQRVQKELDATKIPLKKRSTMRTTIAAHA